MSTEDQNQPEQPTTETKPEATEAAKQKAGAAAGQILASLGKLRQDNPKVFYGAIAGVVALLVLPMMFGGKPEVLSGPGQKNLVVGQSYTLKTPNSAGEKPTVRMVSAPGQMEAYDDTEETDRQGCKNVPEGTHVTVKDLFKQPGMDFAKVEITDGECAGKTMWTLSVNVQ